jgi:ABC-type uncharacterized transport system auxiliary subunit
MSRLGQIASVILLAGITAACGASRPVKYYILDAGPMPAATTATAFPVNLLVARIATSHLYRDDRLVYGSNSMELGTYEYQRWAASPADMVQDMLISALRATGQYHSVSGMGSNSRGDYIVRGHLYSLCELDKPELATRFSLEIELFDFKAGAVVWTGSYSHDAPVRGKGVPDVVESLDKNVRAGMQQLTTSLNQFFASHSPQPRDER